MKPRTPIKRNKPPSKKRPGPPRRGELTSQEKAIARDYIYELSGRSCELNLPGCKGGVLPANGSIFERWHLVHMRAKRRFGWPISGEHRMRGGCYWCHIVQLHGKGVKPDFNNEERRDG